MIQVENLTKYFGDKKAVEDITFSVEKGEILGFLGPNGAGKTTTMRVLTGYLPPNSGKVNVSGFDVVTDALEVKKRIGYLPENPPLYRDMTVTGYLGFIAELKGVSANRRKGHIDGIAEMTGLGDVMGRLIGNLSKGYRQRVGIAQALVGDPDVLILDEPTSGLDPKQIIEIRQLIKGLSEDHTIILSSHILPEVQAICERVVIINKGRLVASDTPESLSAKLRNSRQLMVRVKGTDSREDLFLSIPGVKSVSTEESGHDSILYRIEGEVDRDIREPVFFKMAEAQAPILEMRYTDFSLEEVFLQLTTEEAEVEKIA